MENLELNFKIGPIPRGPYSATTLYAMNDNVQTETGIYGSRKDGNVGHPVTDTEWWSLLVDLSAVKEATDECQTVTEAASAAELARAAAENARALAETARATAETSRVSAEELRASAEESRETAEEERASAETSRESAEDVRAAAETSRVQSETGRAQAENARAAEFAELKEASEEASADALEAAGTANTAAAAADAAREGIQEDLDGKVDKVAGKGLSSEDYTAAEKGKVANMPADTNAELADIVAESTDRKALELLCGQPPILFGAGTPQEAIVPDNWKQFDPETGEGYNWNGNPSAIGQQYINTSVVSGGRYVAGRTSYDKASANYYVLKWYNS